MLTEEIVVNVGWDAEKERRIAPGSFGESSG